MTLPDPSYLGQASMPHPSSLGLAKLNPRNKGLEGDVIPKFLEYGALVKLKILGLARNLGLRPCHTQLTWVWPPCQTHGV